MHDHRDFTGPIRSRFSGNCRRIARLHFRALHRAKLHSIQPFVQNGAKTNQMNLDKITIGRDPVLTYKIMNNIAKREIKRRQRQAKWARIVSTLKFWNK